MINTPTRTSDEPIICIIETLSFKKKYARNIVLTGPIEPINEA